MPGITLGDCGNKVGDSANDTGFMILENVRIPREFMLMKYRRVTEEGKFEEVMKVDPKVHYSTMMTTRAYMTYTASARLAQAATMAIRYSCVREQGFIDSKAGVSYKTKEHQIVDHKIQQYRLFKWLAHAYAFRMNGQWMLDQLKEYDSNQLTLKNTDGLKELAIASAGMKSLCSFVATLGIEDLRKCCGGNGYLLHSGIAALSCDYLWQVTAEGDFIILSLLTAGFLLKSVGKAFTGHKLKGIVDYFNVISEPEFDLEKIHPGNADKYTAYLEVDRLDKLFKYRALSKNINVAMAFNELTIEKGLKFEEAWNQLSNELLSAAYSHSYYLILNNFLKKLSDAPNNKVGNALKRLYCLFACTNILDDNWGDMIDGPQFKLVRQAAYHLMAEIRPDCVTLVDSFDFPDYVLKSSIGRYDGNVYEALFDAAQKSVLNKKEVFEGYEQYLKPHTNKALLKHGNKVITKESKF
jgi:acyl-CoA oxidase